MREKLIELIAEFTENLSPRDFLHKAEFDEKFADFLLQNNVIVLCAAKPISPAAIKAVELRNEGYKIREIAKKLYLCERQVYRYLKTAKGALRNG